MRSAQAGDRPPDHAMLAQVVARLSAEIAGPLTQALGRVASAASLGQIDRSGLLALRHEIDAARHAGLLGQQIARLADGSARPGIEHVDLDQVLRSVLSEQTANASPGMRGHGQSLAPVTLMADTSMVHTMLQAAANWAQTQSKNDIQWTLAVDPVLPLATMTCQFDHREPPAGIAPDDGGVDSLDWLMLRYTAHLSDATLTRSIEASNCVLTLQFRRVVKPMRGDSVQPSTTARSGPVSASLTGLQVLVLAARRDARQRVREALHGHEVFIDYVPNVAAAMAYCDEGSPQALIHEAGFDGEALQGLRLRLAKLKPGVAMIEIMPTGHDCELGTTGLKLGADGLNKTLGAILQMEVAMKA